MPTRIASLLGLLLALLPLSFALSQAQPDPPLVDLLREWHDREDKILAKSRFAYIEGDQVALLPQSGQIVLIPQARLSVTDRQWVTEHPLNLLRGKVIYVADGDTIGVLDDKKTTHRIRLEGIDAPESGQAFGNRSRQALNDLVYGKQVLVTYEKSDTYGRILGQIYLDGQWINRQLIADGWAWHYRHFSGDAELAETQTAASTKKVGLWKDPQPQQPWRFRLDEKRRKEAAAEKDTTDKPMPPTQFWLNSSSGVRHNASCKHFGKTKRGKYCGAEEGKPCGICGG
ncbi:thermonuclease family protein [Blastopirellula marina]|uniref:TNase-like domain-containing protein n=1 Tax=Blastopirellula marina TaxID=124 RepID=A0A2S8FLF9_9BACT|nr:thermonuclease family protein [Blastopirellula marina]PQO33019.1 hypothetical protein C5Y98_17950 [Blastopirellula marina]PTL43186.1 hypothetical protein C5Y97_17960 [Blastopirellula marina]